MFGIDTGMDFGAVTTATCLSAALATAIMAIYARYPIAQAPGMGENFFFVFSAVPAATAAGFANGWQVGTSTVTSFIESAAGMEAGGRTGLTGLVVTALFLFALSFSPLIAMIGGYPPITAPALTIVGAMMMQNVTKIHWKDYTLEGLYIIDSCVPDHHRHSVVVFDRDGLALGFISYPTIKAFSGRGREISWLTYLR